MDAIDAWAELPVLFDRLLVPTAVRTELQRRRGMKNRLRKVCDQYAYVEWCIDYDRTAADILRPERKVRRNKDRGEAETIVQASTRGAIAIVDDRWGRKQAELHRLDNWGTTADTRTVLWTGPAQWRKDSLGPSDIEGET